MDFSQYAAKTTVPVKLHLIGADGKKLFTGQDGKEPVTISLVGVDSENYQAAARASQNRRLAKINPRKVRQVTAEEMENDALEILVACTIAWEGIGWGKEDLKCTPENVRKVYANVPFIREQVDEFINDRSNFLGNSSKNS